MSKKPEPVPTAIKCSKCGLPWDDHGEKPTLETCITLLRRELMRRPPRVFPYATFQSGGITNTTARGHIAYGGFEPYAVEGDE